MIREPNNVSPELQEFFRVLLQGAPIINGIEVSVSAAASTSVQAVRHGLGRVYRGGFVVISDQALAVCVLAPALQTSPELYVYFRLSAATATNLVFWVY